MSKSVEELFRDAPEGTTHWDASGYRINSFMKLEGDMWFYWPPASLNPSWNEWGKSGDHDVRCMIKRPQPKPWSGPEDGLPPVGQECEVEVDGGAYEYCTVLAHGFDDFKPHAVVQCASGLWMEEVTGFRAIKTQEQIDRDNRETAIREIMDVADVDCRVTAARLVDAGFKREVK